MNSVIEAVKLKFHQNYKVGDPLGDVSLVFWVHSIMCLELRAQATLTCRREAPLEQLKGRLSRSH